MILCENCIISDELKSVFFHCDLEKCKGACCVEGDAGAPLNEEEISLLEDYLDKIKPYMKNEGIAGVEKYGVFDYDADGHFVTPLVNDAECVYAYFEKGIARCAIEKAWMEKKIPFQKPVSCHLYPVRIKPSGDSDLVNYHKWDICQSALTKGYQEKKPLYEFLQEALIRKYGRKWYNKLVKQLH